MELAGSWGTAVPSSGPAHGPMLLLVTCCLEVRVLSVLRKVGVMSVRMPGCPSSLLGLPEHECDDVCFLN